MGRLLNIVNPLHRRTKRDYLARMVDNKLEAVAIAKQYGPEYWDGDRRYGYGGYKYDGRWKVVAEQLIKIYQLKPDARILDVGCGKAHLLYELKQLLPEADVTGFDISAYGVANAKEEVRDRLFVHRAQDAYPFGDKQFDLVISLACIHNLRLFELKTALGEMERVGKNKYVMTESYRNERELFNLQCWALTAESFFDIGEWIWLFSHFGYTGDYEFIWFE
jgi:ubiquinone/menaquinone biosynthesis C-methylase UbiE